MKKLEEDKLKRKIARKADDDSSLRLSWRIISMRQNVSDTRRIKVHDSKIEKFVSKRGKRRLRIKLRIRVRIKLRIRI